MNKKIKLPHITFEITSVCNLKCRYCYNIWKMPDRKSDFVHYNSYKQARKTLSRLFRTADVEHITFTGGEPLLAERFTEIVLFARMQKKSVAIISNGNAGNIENYRNFVDLGVHLFELPVHSPTHEAHDFMTDTPGSFQKSVNSIKQLIALNANVVAVIVITKANFEMIDKTLGFIESLGVKRVMLNRFNIGGEGIARRADLELTVAELNHAFALASETGKRLNLGLSSNVCTPLCAVNPDDFQSIFFTTCSTDIRKRPLTIDLQGNLHSCNHSPTVLGNIFEERIEDILDSEKAQLWENAKPDFCGDCSLFSRCSAGCRAAAEQLSASPSAPDPILAQVKRIKT